MLCRDSKCEAARVFKCWFFCFAGYPYALGGTSAYAYNTTFALPSVKRKSHACRATSSIRPFAPTHHPPRTAYRPKHLSDLLSMDTRPFCGYNCVNACAPNTNINGAHEQHTLDDNLPAFGRRQLPPMPFLPSLFAIVEHTQAHNRRPTLCDCACSMCLRSMCN